ncbi:MAG: beta strand repeat-containing protein, partial [Candidatus Kapaibacterium sp.]
MNVLECRSYALYPFRFVFVPITILLFGLTLTLPAHGQNRDFQSERLIIDDNGDDGARNTMTIQTPDSLPQNVILMIPDLGSDSAQFLLVPPGTTGAWLLGGNAGTTPGTNFIGTSDANPLHLYVNGGSSNSLILNLNGSIQRDLGGNARGADAVELQSVRSGPTEVASGAEATISGGRSNRAAGSGATVGGGNSNAADGDVASIGGGANNQAGLGGAIGGGIVNQATGNYSAIAGGESNVASAAHTAVGGGQRNTASGVQAAVGGGSLNTASGSGAWIGGGTLNSASGTLAVVGGGAFNVAAGDRSFVAGGQGLTLSAAAQRSFGFLGGNLGSNNMTVSTPDVAVFGNTDLWLANNNNGASQLRFYEANGTTGAFPGTTNFTSFQAGTQTVDINYILPTATAATSTVEEGFLQLDAGTGQLSWVDPASVVSSAWSLTGNAGTTPGTNYLGTSDAQGVHIYVNGGADNSLILNTNGSIQRDTAGDGRGEDAVDLQSSRGNATQVASGRYSTIGGGRRNSAINIAATVAGGDQNVAQGRYVTVGGGFQNIANSSDGLVVAAMTIGGGYNNQVTGILSTIAGGASNTASGPDGAIGGGNSNSISGQTNTIGGGVFNSVTGFRSVIGGGDRNSVGSRWSVVPGGRGLTLGGESSFGFLGGNRAGTVVSRGNNRMTLSEDDIAVFGNVDLLLANNNGAASRLRFYEANSVVDSFPTATTYYTSFEAGDQSEDINYILPTSLPSVNGQFLSSDTNGVMSWVGAGWSLTGNAGTTAGTNFLGTTDSTALHLYVNSGSNNSLILNTNGSIQRDTGGIVRGLHAVDLQMIRLDSTEVASGIYSVIGGGRENLADTIGSTVAGGTQNWATGYKSFVGGGDGNWADGSYSVVAGGNENFAYGWKNFIGGGDENETDFDYAVVAGGNENIAVADGAFIGGGEHNFVGGGDGAIAGGYYNEAWGEFSAVGGGVANVAYGGISAIPGGAGLTLGGDGSFGYLGRNFGDNNMTILDSNLAVFGNVDLWLANNDTTARQLRFYEAESDSGSFPSGTNYTSFEAGDQSEDINYILPTAGPVTNGQVLSSDTNGVMSWVGAGWSLTGNAGTTAGTNFLGTTDSTALHLYVNGGSNNSLILNTNGSTQRDVGGNGRGVNAVDLQITRGGAAQVASGDYAVIGGGQNNTVGGASAAILGGFGNRAGAAGSVVSGGIENIVTGVANASAIGGGEQNQVASILSVVSGGALNVISSGANGSAIPGGSALTLGASGSFGFQGGNPSFTRRMDISEADVAVFGNVDLLLANNVGSASRLRFYEANGTAGAFPPATTFYTSFEAGNQSEDINYILPTAGPSANGQVLSSDTNGVMSWVDGGGTAWSLTGNAGTTPGTHYIGTSDTTALHLYVNGGTINSLILNTNGSIQRDTAGNARGDRAIDLQSFRSTSTQVASGAQSFIGGGRQNTASGAQAVVGGGFGNVASGGTATVSGGKSDTASGSFSTVGGGLTNVASGTSSTIAGGESNTASATRATVSGGQANVASGVASAVGGGVVNSASGQSST